MSRAASYASEKMVTGAKTLYLALDAMDLDLAQEMAARGELPNLAHLLQTSALVETRAPLAYFVSSTWPSLFTGLGASRHGYVCWDEIAGGTYEYRETDPDAIGGTPFWETLSDAGRRVAVLDAPHARLASGLNGVQLVEWGGHDRHRRTSSWPPSFLGEIEERFGAHPIGCWTAPGRQFAPCDYLHRASDHRDAEENAALLADLRDGHARKRAVSLDLLQREDWDLFFNVLGEAHCAGHQFWYLHDPSHPRHDAQAARQLGGDPLARVYRDLDATVGAHLECVGPETTVYVHLSHGMHAHYDGTHLLDAVLWRLDQYVSGEAEPGTFTRSADRIASAMPSSLRGRSFSALAKLRGRMVARFPYATFDDVIPPRADRRWWAQPNNTVAGSLRLNVYDREPDGRILRSRSRRAASWLADRLRDLVNLDSGEPLVERVLLTDDHLERYEGDSFGDLIVEWNHRTPIERVWSPATGVVQVPYTHWRTGDHHRRGLMLVTGRGIAAGRRSSSVDAIHVAPTVAASLGVELPDIDGSPVWDLVPEQHRRGAVAPTGLRVLPERPADTGTPRRWPESCEVNELVRQGRELRGLLGAHHETRVAVDSVRAAVDAKGATTEQSLAERMRELERLASIATTSAWLRQVDVRESMMISVVMPTRNRCDRVMTAIASVQAQRYSWWELLVVDDGSEDDTWGVISRAAAHDDRIRPLRIEHSGVAAARNHALDHAAGDAIVYLDDDNRFDPDWLHAVAWAFGADNDRRVLYGARLVDDVDRHYTGRPGGDPYVQFLPWDRGAVEEFNRVDMNVLAHLPSEARFDPRVDYFADWDLILKLTDHTDPYELPVIAAYYTTDGHDRMTLATTPDALDLQYEHVRDNLARRRGR